MDAILVNEKSNGAREMIQGSFPYTVTVTVEGSSDFLFHAWNAEAVDEKGRRPKGSKEKKRDDIESYVFRMPNRELAIPGYYLCGSIVKAAKFRQDPRSPRKSAEDLFKAGVFPLTLLAPLGTADWDYLDKRRVMVQRNGINRTRPAMRAGWRATFDLQVNLPEYIDATMLREVIEQAGRLIGIGDYRPTFGRYGVVGYTVHTE